MKLKPHHLLCIHGFKGKGYSPAYVENFWRVIQELKNSTRVTIEITSKSDVICEPCPHRSGQECETQAKISQLDEAYSRLLEISDGTTMTWSQAEEMVARKVSENEFEKSCEPCSWKSLGYCRAALIDLKKKHRVPPALLGVFIALGFMLVSPFSFQAWAQPSESVEATEAEDINEQKTSSVPVTPPDLDAVVSDVPSVKKPQPKTSPAVPELDENGLLTAEQIDRVLSKRRNKQFRVLKDAVAYLQKKQFSRTLVELRKYPADTEFSDYVHFMSGQAELGLMRNLAKAGRRESAIAAGERARAHFQAIVNGNVYSSLIKRSNVLLGETELEMADAMSHAKSKKSKALSIFESGFQRLLQSGLLILTPQPHIVTYALLCERNPSELCESWIERLIGYLDKDEDAKLTKKIAAFRQRIIVKAPKRQARQYNVSLDLQAFQKGYNQYLSGDFNGAYETWYELLKEYPQTNIKLRTKFWMGRAAQRTNHEIQAQTLYKEIIRDAPFAYYALLASWFGKIDPSRMVSGELPQLTRLSANSSPSELFQLRRAELFIANDIPELARLELRDFRIAQTMPNEFLMYLGYLNHRARNHRVASTVYFELSARGYPGMFSSFGEKIFFPVTFYDEARKAAQDHNIDALIPLSIMKQESAFDTEAVSYANAYGLMQLIRPTAKEMDPKVSVPQLFDPEHNIKLGTKYIAQLLKRYKGNLAHALAAYNAGPYNSERWQKEMAPTLAPEEYIELIGYKETREYVQSIVRNIFWYTRILKGETISDLSTIINTTTRAPSSMRTKSPVNAKPSGKGRSRK